MIFLTGCEQRYLAPISPARIIHDGVIYSVTAYTPAIHDQLQIEPLFSELELTTTFLFRVENTNDFPIQTRLENTFILHDHARNQFTVVQDPFIFVKQYVQKNMYSDLSYVELQNTDLKLDRLMEWNITTEDVDYYRSEVSDLKDKIHLLEQQQLLQQELDRREKDLKSTMKRYGFKDQMIYPHGKTEGLITFPPITRENLTNLTLFFLLPDEKTVSVSFSIKTSN